MPDAILIAMKRTAFAKAGGKLRHQSARHLAARLVAPLLHDVALAAETIDEVILGNCLQGGNLARSMSLEAGLPVGIPAMTVDRQCSSGLDAILAAAMRIRAGFAHALLAGGVESCSTAPWRVERPAHAQALPRFVTQAPFTGGDYPDPDMIAAADGLADRLGLSRVRMDDVVLRSHHLASGQAGLLSGETDEGPRADMTIERLARLPTLVNGGVQTLAHIAAAADGAALGVIVSDDLWRDLGRPFGLRLVEAHAAGCDPALPGLGAASAAAKLSAPIFGLDHIALVEAFAAQVLASIDVLDLDAAIVNPAGGGLAFGHPYGASGAWAAGDLFHALKRKGGGRGLALVAVAGGQGLAALFDSV